MNCPPILLQGWAARRPGSVLRLDADRRLALWSAAGRAFARQTALALRVGVRWESRSEGRVLRIQRCVR